jgi:hypothetical protein
MKALLIGINEYRQSPLRGCVNDVHRIAEHIPSDAEVEVLLDAHATHTGVLNGLDWLVCGHGRKLLHFSGHGTYLDIDGNGEQDAFLCVDYEDGGLITLNDLHRIFDHLSAASELVVLADCCHSGSLSRDTYTRPRFIPFSPRMQDDIVSCRSLEMVRRQPVPRVAIMASCLANQTAADSRFPDGFYGAFTYFVTRCLSSTINHDLAHICAQVRYDLRASGFQQTPMLIAEGSWEWM